MKIIVTGGAGFLGTHLCRALVKAGHELKIIDLKPNQDFRTIIADIRDAEAMDREIRDADVVFHLAALIEAGESVKEPQKFIDTNITGTVNVMEAMRKNGLKKFAFSSSAAIYGDPKYTPIKEDDRTMPINPYGMTKLSIEALLSSYVKSHDFTGVALRYFNLYGPEELHEPETHAIPRFIKQIYQGEEVTVWGDGGHLRDFIHVQDIVSGHLLGLTLMAEQPGHYHYFNLSTNRPNSVMEIIRLLEELMNKKAQIKHFPDRPGDPRTLTADATKAKKVLKWEAQIPIKEGLKQTVDYFVKIWES